MYRSQQINESGSAWLLLGTPVWWETTKYHRPSLPRERIQAVSDAISADPLRLPVQFTVVVEGMY